MGHSLGGDLEDKHPISPAYRKPAGVLLFKYPALDLLADGFVFFSGVLRKLRHGKPQLAIDRERGDRCCWGAVLLCCWGDRWG